MLLPLVPAVVFAALVATTSFGDGLRETSDGDERGLAAYLMIVGAIASTVLVTLGVGLRKLLRHQTRVAEHEPPRQQKVRRRSGRTEALGRRFDEWVLRKKR